MTPPHPELVLRLGTHAEKDYFEKLAPMFDGIVLGANLLESTPGATSSLVFSLCNAKNGTAYYIDPMTYAFGVLTDPQSAKPWTDLDWLKSEQQVKGKGKKKETVRGFKRSYRLLAQAFGDPFNSAVANSKALSVAELMDPTIAQAMAAAVVSYQLTRVRLEFEQDPDFKDYAASIPIPAAVFAPYFYCEPSAWDPWLTANLRLAEEAARIETPAPVHAVVSADAAALLDGAFVGRLTKELPKTGIKGVWLWFSRFFEEDAELPTLQAIKRLTQDLSEANIAVFNMHGGYFSLALSKHGMTGISHGVGYGEQKDVVPVLGQSVPTVRYYLPALHRRLGVPDIERCFDALGIKTPADFHAKVCDCPVCKGIVSKDLKEFRAFGETQPSATSGLRLVQTPAAAKRCRFHYLITRIRERDRIVPMTISDIQAMWDIASSSWGKQPLLAESSKHLPRWRAALA